MKKFTRKETERIILTVSPRQGGRCWTCGTRLTYYNFEINLIDPDSEEEDGWYENIQLLCMDCARKE